MIHYQTEKETGKLWLCEKEFLPEYEQKTESVFAQCNGYLGVRAAHPFSLIEEQRGMFLCGAFHKAYEDEVTELVNCPDITWFQLEADGEKILPERASLTSFERKLDLFSGELVIRYVFELSGNRKIAVENRRFASMEQKNLFVQALKIHILAGNIRELKIKTGINGQVTNSGVSHFHKSVARVYEKEVMEIRSELEEGTVIEAVKCKLAAGLLLEKEFSLKRRSIYGTYVLKPDNGLAALEKITFVNQGENGITADKRKEALHAACATGYEVLFEKHQKRMESFWDTARIRVEGMSQEEEAAICFAQYHMIGMTPWHTNECSIAAKGLTGEGYKGHVFWDTEIFLFPMLLYLYPKEARRILEFRYLGLDGARKKAKDYGFQGAMFPWEAAKTGDEETPLYAALNIHTGKANKVWSGIKEYHVTADIAYAVEQYRQAANDWDFMEKCGYEIVFEAARFWVSCAKWDETRHQYGIFDVIGPDEYTEHVDNNAYTNYMAVYCVKTALNYAKTLKQKQPNIFSVLDWKLGIEKELGIWEEFVEKMYLATPGADGIIPQDDTFLSKPCMKNIAKYKTSQIKQAVLLDYSREEIVNMQVLKQADVVMLLNLFPHLFAEDIVKKNVLFYEGKTIHDSSLSYCAHAQACAAIGAMDLSWEFFQKCLVVDLDENPHDSTDGVHSASLGGIWNCLIFGFAGVRYENGVLYLNPHLPNRWKSMDFRIIIKGVQVHVLIEKKKITLACEPETSTPIQVEAKGRSYTLEKVLEIEG